MSRFYSILGWTLFSVLNAVLGYFLIIPGHLSVDEGIYHLMAFGYQQGDGSEIWNGWTEFPTTELRILKTFPLIEGNGRLVSQYPQFGTWLSNPLYTVFGYLGLFYTNLLVFPILVFCTHQLGKRMGNTDRAGLIACTLLVFGTFVWDYALAAWPHMLATTIGIGALTLFLNALDGGKYRAPLFVLSGFLIVLSCGVRVDNAFVLASMLCIGACRPPKDWKYVFLFGLACLPLLVVMGWINFEKWGSWNPFSYGPRANITRTTFDPKIILFFTGLIGFRLLFLHPSIQRFARRNWLQLLSSCFLSITLLTVSVWGEQIRTIAHGAFTLLVDLRYLPEKSELAMVRSPTGAVLYLFSFKKSLLQSLPFLPLLLFSPFLAKNKLRLWLSLGILPTGLLLYLGRTHWHGGLCLNQRYFLSCLPLFAAMTVPTLERLLVTERISNIRWMMLGGVIAIALFLIGVVESQDSYLLSELFFLQGPLYLGIGCFVLTGLRLWTPLPFHQATLVVIGITIAWGGLTGVLYDSTRQRAERQINLDRGLKLGSHLEDDSVVFLRNPGPGFQLIERDQIRIALPFQDNFEDFSTLVSFHLNQERPVYLFLSARDLNNWSKSKVAKGLGTTTIANIDHLYLKQIKWRATIKNTSTPKIESK